jgi:hypothetical protein
MGTHILHGIVYHATPRASTYTAVKWAVHCNLDEVHQSNSVQVNFIYFSPCDI